MRDDKAWKHRKETGGQPGQRKAVLFAGTTEGRLLTAYLTGLGCRTVVWVATEYGRDVLEQDGLAGGTDGKGPDDRILFYPGDGGLLVFHKPVDGAAEHFPL